MAIRLAVAFVVLYQGRMRILVIENHPGGTGLIGQGIEARGGECDVVNPHLGGEMPAATDGFDGVIVLGGPQHAGDDGNHPAFPPMLELLAAFHRASKPVLGICLGGQLLARAFGGSVFRHRKFEFGFVPIRITGEGGADALLGGLDGTHWIFQWHEDTFDPPAGATLPIAGESCVNQAFRLGAATYGFQCHFEVDEALVRSWLAGGGAESARRKLGGKFDSAVERLEGDFDNRLPAAADFARAVIGRWLDLAAATRQAPGCRRRPTTSTVRRPTQSASGLGGCRSGRWR